MPYYPNIPRYAPFYVQADTDVNAVNLLTAYGAIVKAHDYPMTRTPKAPYKNEWHDENGDDEYLGGGLFFESFTFKVDCVMLIDRTDSESARETLLNQVKALQSKLCAGEFKIYDSWTRFGFRKVRVNSFPMPSREDFKSLGNRARLFFSIEFKVNDPVTRMKMQGLKIIEA